jgi:hypothetical protein
MSHLLLRHPETGGSTLIPDDGDLLRLFEARGWQRSDELPAEAAPFIEAGDMRAVNEVLARQDAIRQAEAAQEAEALKGKALDQALKDAGISASGLTADQKRAALAEHEAGTAATTTDENEGAE